MTAPTVSDSQFGDLQLYRVADAMRLLRLSRAALYEQMRKGRLRSIKQGRCRLFTSHGIREYIALLEAEASK